MAAGNSTLVESNGYDHIIVGFTYSFISAVQLVIYIPCMTVMYRENEFRQSSCFTLMRHQGIADFINIVQQLVLGVIVMGNFSAAVPQWFNKYFFGTTTALAWQSYVALCHTIALNRCVVICFFQYETTFFSASATKMWVFACWFHACLWWFAAMTPWLHYQYFPTTFALYFDMNTAWGGTAHLITWWESAGLIVLSGCWYLGIIAYLRVERHSMPEESTEAADSVQKQERQILKRAGVICIFAIILNQYWCIAGYTPEYRYKYVIGNTLWVLNSGINPAVYLTMNKTIRNKVKEMLGIKDNSVVPVEQGIPMNSVPKRSLQSKGSKNANDLRIVSA